MGARLIVLVSASLLAAGGASCALVASLGDYALADAGAEGAADASMAAHDTGVVDAREASRPTDAAVDAEASPPDAPFAVDAPRAACPSLTGPSMVRIAVDAGSYCIDSTEVTVGQYDAFLAADSGGNAPPACAGNLTLQPNCTFPSSGVPIACVDWCDAYAFCQWAGKVLCGRIGGGSVTFSGADFVNPEEDAWFAACSAEGTRTFPYGNGFQSGVCNLGSVGTVPVGSETGCVGGYPGIFDMSGNVWEFEDACQTPTTGLSDLCNWRGESYASTTTTGCGDYVYATRDSMGSDLGFRCCTPN
jgi:sulfatase modifying factor 1